MFLATKTKETAKIIPIIILISSSYYFLMVYKLKNSIVLIVICWLVIVLMLPLSEIKTDSRSNLKYEIKNVKHTAKAVSDYLYPNPMAFYHRALEWIDVQDRA